jgi:hypothetical protein
MSLRDAARLFIRGDVQAILRSFTKPELHVEKVLRTKFNTKLKKTRLQLLTDEDLNKVSVSKEKQTKTTNRKLFALSFNLKRNAMIQ